MCETVQCTLKEIPEEKPLIKGERGKMQLAEMKLIR
jgi:hypothetical protein